MIGTQFSFKSTIRTQLQTNKQVVFINRVYHRPDWLYPYTHTDSLPEEEKQQVAHESSVRSLAIPDSIQAKKLLGAFQKTVIDKGVVVTCQIVQAEEKESKTYSKMEINLKKFCLDYG